MTLFGALGIFAARLSNATMEVGSEIFVTAVLLYIIANQSCFIILSAIERYMSLNRKANKTSTFRFGICIIIIIPTGTSGAIGGAGAREGKVVGIRVIPTVVFGTVVITWILIVLFFRKAKRLARTVVPIKEESQSNIDMVNHSFHLSASDMPLYKNGKVAIEPAIGQAENTQAFRKISNANHSELEAVKFLRSCLKRSGQTLADSAKRNVCFYIGKEVEIWRREKVLRRIEKEKETALKCILMLLCYIVCFFPLSFLCCFQEGLSYRNVQVRLCCALAALFVIFDPTIYILRVNSGALAEFFRRKIGREVQEAVQ